MLRPVRSYYWFIIASESPSILVLQTLDESKLPALYAEFVLLDRREIDFKKRKLEGADPNGVEEAQIRHKFLGERLFNCRSDVMEFTKIPDLLNVDVNL